MKEYVKPVVLETNEMSEGVFANYGSGEEQHGHITARWGGHDSGHFSNLRVKVYNDNNATYESVTLTFRLTDSNKIFQYSANAAIECSDASYITNNGNTFTLTINHHFNPNGDSFEFAINNMLFSNSPAPAAQKDDPNGYGAYWDTDGVEEITDGEIELISIMFS